MLSSNVLAIAAVGLASFVAAGPAARPCGLKIAPCPHKTTCVPLYPGCTNLDRCRGTCVAKKDYYRSAKKDYPSCGGHRANPPKCPAHSTCKDDPRIPNNCGMACDRPGICIPKNAPSCGGFAGRPCPKGLRCYDAPNDGCDPNKGGADCIGVCL
ncbi:Kazal domain-containing protein [Hirsutella rhossiliensis]|uniref:Kazal domain-containing protein n=1 Tax=Hirsutella rhossiliensis TaxID=111463 RepID=A0A9P8SER5_9HYPO|nr:Kazal domain-containing protein [Hirsutella rhossiliensis]KAH0959299.1 Kazal domain-containing protein [Hirsutella rhossiliensis]